MEERTPDSIRERYKSAFFKGLAAILPTVLTVYILLATYNFVDQNVAVPINNAIKAQLKTEAGREIAVRSLKIDPELLHERQAKAFERAVEEKFPDWVGFAFAIFICFFVGFFIASFLGKRIWSAVERWFMRMPVVRAIYPSAKQITEFFIKDETKGQQFSRVGFVPFPTEGQWSLGFVMAEGFQTMDRHVGARLQSVFVPMAPTPVTGFVVLVPEEKIVAVDMSVDEAFRYYVTAGLVIPDRHKAVPMLEVVE